MPANAPSFRLEVFGNEKQAVVAFVLIVVTLAMALVALIAAAGFVVVAQRRQRQLGLLAALGATERHLRLVMLANGVIVGVAAAVVGGALGILGWMVAAPAVEAAAGHRIDRLALPWGLIGECLALAVVAAAAAAWWPARAMSRVPVMAALSRRPARPAPVHRSLALAVGLLGLGVAAIVAADPNGDVRPLVLIGGLVTMIVGLVFAAPGAIRALGAVAGRLPFAPRLALRDLVRYQARTAGALAAITLGLGIAVSIVVLAEINEYRPDEGNLSSRELLVEVAGDQHDSLDPTLTPAARSRLDADAAAIAAAVGSQEVVALEVALNPATGNDNAVVEPVGVLRPIDHGYRGVDQPYVATPALLAHLGIDPGSIDPATELLTSLPDHPGPLLLVDISVRPDGGERQHRRPAGGPARLLVRPPVADHRARHGASTAGSRPRPGGWSSRPLPSPRSRSTPPARPRPGSGFTVESRSAQDELAALRTGSTVVGALLALAIVAMAIGLLRGEAAADLRTLTATGATSRTRRALTASTAGALALLGVAPEHRRGLRRPSSPPTTASSTASSRCPSPTSSCWPSACRRWRRSAVGSSPAASPGPSPVKPRTDPHQLTAAPGATTFGRLGGWPGRRTPRPSVGGWRWSRGPPAAPGGASPPPWARRGRRSTAPAAPAGPGRCGPTTTGPRPSRTPPTSSTSSAAPGSRWRSTTSTRPRSTAWPSASGATTATSTCSSTTSGAARCSRAAPPTGTPPSGSTTSTRACASSAWPSRPTWSRPTTSCPSSSTGPAGWWWR